MQRVILLWLLAAALPLAPVSAAPPAGDAVGAEANRLEVDLTRYKDTSPEAGDVLAKLVDLYHGQGRPFGLVLRGPQVHHAAFRRQPAQGRHAQADRRHRDPFPERGSGRNLPAVPGTLSERAGGRRGGDPAGTYLGSLAGSPSRRHGVAGGVAAARRRARRAPGSGARVGPVRGAGNRRKHCRSRVAGRRDDRQASRRPTGGAGRLSRLRAVVPRRPTGLGQYPGREDAGDGGAQRPGHAAGSLRAHGLQLPCAGPTRQCGRKHAQGDSRPRNPGGLRPVDPVPLRGQRKSGRDPGSGRQLHAEVSQPRGSFRSVARRGPGV